MAKTAGWDILKKKELTGRLSNTKGQEDQKRQLKLIQHSITGEENPFTTPSQVKNTLDKVGMALSKSTVKRWLHECKYRSFTTRCKPLVMLKNRQARFHLMSL